MGAALSLHKDVTHFRPLCMCACVCAYERMAEYRHVDKCVRTRAGMQVCTAEQTVSQIKPCTARASVPFTLRLMKGERRIRIVTHNASRLVSVDRTG